LRNRAVTVPLILILHMLDGRCGRAGIKVWPMKAASVLFGCVGVAGSAQEEDEVCEDILQRNVVLITPFSSSRIPPPYIRLSTR
jgi:hypothetical protein